MENEKLFLKSNFSFPHSVFKRFILQTHTQKKKKKPEGLFVKGLIKPEEEAFEDIMEKWENAADQYFLLF